MAKVTGISFEDNHCNEILIKYQPIDQRSAYKDKNGDMIPSKDEMFVMQVTSRCFETDQLSRTDSYFDREDAVAMIRFLREMIDQEPT